MVPNEKCFIREEVVNGGAGRGACYSELLWEARGEEGGDEGENFVASYFGTGEALDNIWTAREEEIKADSVFW